jgi:molecular chaperone DnaK
LSEGEIDKMVRDAEAHAEEDLKFEEMVKLRNQADGLIHAARKAVKDAGDKATDAEKEKVETAAKALEEAIKGDDKDAIEKRIEALTEATGALAQKMYADASANAGANPGADGHATDAGDGAVDAEFEEVKDDKKN